MSHEAAPSQFSNGKPSRSEIPTNYLPISADNAVQRGLPTAVNSSFEKNSPQSIKEKLNKRMQERKARINQNKNEIQEIQSKLEML